MAKRKNSGEQKRSPLQAAFSLVQVVRFELLLAIALIALLGTGIRYAWRKWGIPVTQQARYQLSADSIDVTPQPPWIRSDVRADAARDASLGNLSIFDKDLTIRIYRAFEMQAWVDRVYRVSKQPPAKVLVELEYRRPVAWVEVPPKVLPNDQVGVLPVDGKGVLLPPDDFSQQQLDDYLRISIEHLTPCGLPGTAWGDSRVTAAAQIASLLAEHARLLGLYRIVVNQSADTEPGRFAYEINTRRGTRFFWGNPPGREMPGEPSAAQKATRLIQIAQTIPEGQAVSSPIDLRDQEAGQFKPRTAHGQETMSR